MDNVSKILEEHKLWLECKLGGVQANFCGENLSNANLSNVNLSYANLYGTNLSDANLNGADLRCADLRCANLINADLSDTDLRGANFYDAKLVGANLHRVSTNQKTSFFHLRCPEKGSFVAWKKASGHIVRLLIPEDAKRSSATTTRCRADKAIVLDIENLDGTPALCSTVASDYDPYFKYPKGDIVSVHDFCEDRWQESVEGIHFFTEREEAVRY